MNDPIQNQMTDTPTKPRSPLEVDACVGQVILRLSSGVGSAEAVFYDPEQLSAFITHMCEALCLTWPEEAAKIQDAGSDA